MVVGSMPKPDCSKSHTAEKGSSKRRGRRSAPPTPILKDFQLEDLRRAFEVFDTAGEGRMPTRDLKIAIKACGLVPNRDEIRKIASELDPDEEGFISLDDFICFVTTKMKTLDSREEISRAYKFFDRENKGWISFQDLKNCSIEVGQNLHDEELQEMIEEADSNGDGLVDEEEFAKIMTKTYYMK